MILAFAQQGAAAPSGAAALAQFIPMAAIFALAYFMLIAPMRKQQKQTREMLAALKKGDRVVTSGGIFGTVRQVEEKFVYVQIADQVKVKVARSAITGLADDPETPKEAA